MTCSRSWCYVTLLLLTCLPAAAQNLIANGDFELPGTGAPSRWHVDVSAGATATVSGTGARSGSQGLVLQTPAEPADGHVYLWPVDVLKIEPHKRYRLQVWVRGTGRLNIGYYEYGPGNASLGGVWPGDEVVNTGEQWRLFEVYYGREDAQVEGVRPYISLVSPGNRVAVDDVRLEVVPLPSEPQGPANGSFSAPASAADGIPGWAGSAERLSLESDGGNGQCLRLDARLTAQEARGSLRPEDAFKWWPASSVITPPNPWLHSQPFAVEGGTAQELRFRLRARLVHGLQIKLSYLDRDGKPYGPNSLIGTYYLGGTRDGSWGFETFTCHVTSPATASQAQLEFVCLPGGGSIWVDDVSCRSLLAPPFHWSKMTTAWGKGSEAPPAPTPAAHQPQPAPDLGPAPAQAVVAEGADGPVVRFPNGLNLKVLVTDTQVAGISEIALGTVRFRNPSAPPLAPLVETTEGGIYASCTYRGCRVAGDGSVVVDTELGVQNGESDRLEWHLAPHEVTVGTLTYQGLAYWYVFRSARNHVLQIADRATWELGGSPLGVTVVDQNSYAYQAAYPISADSTYCSVSGTRFVGGEALEYQFANDGALLSYFAHPAFIRYARTGSPEFISLRNDHQFGATLTAETVPTYVVYASKGSPDLWLRARDFAYDRARREVGIRRDVPLPIANVWLDWEEAAEIGADKCYRKIITDYLPVVARCGFKRIMIHDAWVGGGCGHTDLVANPEHGGEKGLKELCDAAHARGIGVIAWFGPGELSTKSPVLKEHPEFVLKGREGRPVTTYSWPDVTAVDLTGPWIDYALSHLRHIREATGLDGFWLDSYVNFTHAISCATRELEIAQAAALPRYHAEIQELGYITYTESSSDFGIKGNGLQVGGLDSPDPNWPVPEDFVDTSPYTGSWSTDNEVRLAEGLAEGDRYFRYLANKCAPLIYWRRFRDRADWLQKLATANLAYDSVVQHLDQRQLLPDDRGVKWISADGQTRVFFAYRAQSLAVPAGAKLLRMPEMKPASVSNGSCQLEAGSVWLLR